MTFQQSLIHGVKHSGGYFLSTFIFGVMFGITAAATGISQGYTLLMSASIFSATALFAALEFWTSPMPFATIALTVALVSTRHVLLGMAFTYHLDHHNLRKRLLHLFLLTDPGVISALQQDKQVDRLGHMSGMGMSLMLSWLSSVWLGLNLSHWVKLQEMVSLSFAGPLVMTTMMMLAVRGNQQHFPAWLVSGVVALLLHEWNVHPLIILLSSVAAGAALTFWRESHHAQ